MSLDTVIKIGKHYRAAKASWRFHDQVNWANKDVENLFKKKDKNNEPVNTTYLNLPVRHSSEKLQFDFEKLTEISDEDRKKEIYYLNFKTSKKDAEKRYLLGDIVYSFFINKKGEAEENGNYRMAKDKKISSFFRCEDAASKIENGFIQQFRNAFRENAERIEEILKSEPSVVLHFDFDGKRWLDFDGIIEAIDDILTESLVTNTEFGDKVSLDKYLYKTLGGATPGFKDESRYKNRLFSRDEIISLMYAGKAAEKPTIRINNIGIIALPHSDKLSSADVISFFERDEEMQLTVQRLEEEEKKEEEIANSIENDLDSDFLFAKIIENDLNDKVKFDIVFTSIPGSPAGVFYDLIEIANIEKSSLIRTNEKIREARFAINNAALHEMPNLKSKPIFDIRASFLNMLGDVTKDKKKYHYHLLKTIPKIYTDTYYSDPILLPAFTDKVEYNIRNGGQSFSTLKYHFYFLQKIQKLDNMTQITESKSYAIGQALGMMAKPFAAWRDDCPIKSFEKSYVGNLTRRIADVKEVTKFADFLNQKLTIHEKAYKTEKDAFLSLVDTIKNFQNEKYNKHYCSLGFFESYFAPINKKEINPETINSENQ